MKVPKKPSILIKKVNPLPILGLAMLCLASCTTSYYAPSPHNTPMLQEQHEASLAVFRTQYDQTLSTDVQVAFSPIKGAGAMFNASFFQPQRSQVGDLNYGMRGSLMEGAAGYYTKVGDVSFDAYVGYGYLTNGATSIAFYWNDPKFDIDFNYHRFFLQPSMGYKHDFFDLNFSLRISQLKYQQVFYDTIPDEEYLPEDFLTIYNHEDFTMVEPALTVKLGYKYVKFKGQMGMCYNVSARNFAHDRFAFSVGLELNFRPSFLKSEPTELERQLLELPGS